MGDHFGRAGTVSNLTSVCWVSKMVIPVYGVRERLSVIGYTNHVMNPEVLAQNPKSSQIYSTRHSVRQ